MTSVGYGDMSPITPQGQAVATIIMLSGILTLAVRHASTVFGWQWLHI